MYKALVVASLLLNVVLCSPEWEQWKAKYRKGYAPGEEPKRYQLWLKNRAMVNAHNERYEKKEVTYSLELNHHSDLTDEEKKRLTGHIPLKRGNREELHLPKFRIAEKDLPASVNWVEKGAVTSVKQQSSCGSCYTFSAVAAAEGQYFQMTGTLINLSEQQLLDCTNGDDGNAGCNGGNTMTCYKYAIDNGMASWFDYPYWARDEDKCHYGKANSTWAPKDQAYALMSSEKILKQMVAELGPVAIAFSVMNDFYNMQDGIYDSPTCSKYSTNHALTVVGYGTEDGKDYWLIKNSWSYTWGDGGYGKIARNKGKYGMCNIATQLVVPMPIKF